MARKREIVSAGVIHCVVVVVGDDRATHPVPKIAQQTKRTANVWNVRNVRNDCGWVVFVCALPTVPTSKCVVLLMSEANKYSYESTHAHKTNNRVCVRPLVASVRDTSHDIFRRQ